MIELLYDFGWQSREVAVEMHVNESRVSQIKTRAISKLRLQLEPGSIREGRIKRLSLADRTQTAPTLLPPRESASSAANRDNSPLGFTLGKSLRNRMVILAIVGSDSGSLRSSSGLVARRTSRVGLARPG